MTEQIKWCPYCGADLGIEDDKHSVYDNKNGMDLWECKIKKKIFSLEEDEERIREEDEEEDNGLPVETFQMSRIKDMFGKR